MHTLLAGLVVHDRLQADLQSNHGMKLLDAQSCEPGMVGLKLLDGSLIPRQNTARRSQWLSDRDQAV